MGSSILYYLLQIIDKPYQSIHQIEYSKLVLWFFYDLEKTLLDLIITSLLRNFIYLQTKKLNSHNIIRLISNTLFVLEDAKEIELKFDLLQTYPLNSYLRLEHWSKVIRLCSVICNLESFFVKVFFKDWTMQNKMPAYI